jgi:hypothetical protein
MLRRRKGMPRPKTTTGWAKCRMALYAAKLPESMLEDADTIRRYTSGKRPYSCGHCANLVWLPQNVDGYTCQNTVWK